VPGIHASGSLSARRLEQGFQMITVASDLLAIRAGMAGALDLAHGALGAADDGAVYCRKPAAAPWTQAV
jgi:hypothetical protein